ncbi:MAG TPA: Imm26 family immunity protein, partial [Actinomycetes bacterium]|nr:Imm26 family immunity protein [Actinomycetes bacterium]
EVITNLRVLKRSRTQPHSGDVFAMQLPDGTYLFGRVIRDNVAGPVPGATLIYIYSVQSSTIRADLSQLGVDKLLIPPTFPNRMPWTRGYFVNVASAPLRGEDCLPKHCFWTGKGGSFVDEWGDRLEREVPPTGFFGLTSYRMVDDLISDVLGIPRAPD